MKKSRIALLIATFVLLLSGIVYGNIPDHSPAFYVNDFANVLTSSTRQHIELRNLELQEISGAQIVVTTMDFTGGVGAYDFALQMFNEWGIGSATEHNGVLMFLAIGDEDYAIILGDGLGNILTAGAVDRIVLDYFEPRFDAHNYDLGVMDTFNQIFDRLYSFYQANPVAVAPVAGNVAPLQQNAQPSTDPMTTIFAVIFILVIIIIAMNIMGRSRRRVMGMPMGRRRRRGFGSNMFWWMMPSPMQRRNRPPRPRQPVQRTVAPPKPKYKGHSTAFKGGGGLGGGGIGRGGMGRGGGGGRSSGGGIGRRK